MTRRNPRAEIGIIGGSGLYRLAKLHDSAEILLQTPFGSPSGPITAGTLYGRRVAFLPRHGPGHLLLPTEIPARANIYALRELGVRAVFAVSAVGSLSEKYAPGEFVVPDQLVNRTKGLRPGSFFGKGLVGHIPMADPFCTRLRGTLLAAATRAGGVTTRDEAVYCCIEGPQFSTRAESELYRSWGMGIIGMTAVPEAVLAREAELCYAVLALVTDYDCWHDGEESVSADLVAETVRRNVVAAGEVLRHAVALVDTDVDCTCRHALDAAVLTDMRLVPSQIRKRLGLLLGDRFPAPR